jgi:DNA-binding response OmpR family regulator
LITGSSAAACILPVVSLVPEAEVLYAGELEVRPADNLAIANGEILRLSVREFQLLTWLAREEGRIVSREELYRSVWRRRFRSDDRSVDVYVHKLRVKLEEALPEWQFIHTHFGFGYRFQPRRLQLGNTPTTAS